MSLCALKLWKSPIVKNGSCTRWPQEGGKPTAKPGEGILKMLKMREKASGFSLSVKEKRPKASRKWKQYLSN